MESVQSDEPFTIRDIQFNDPQIIVLRLAPIEVFGEFPRRFGLLPPRTGPAARAVRLGHPFIGAAIAAVVAHHHHDGAAIAITLGKNGGKAAGGLYLPQQRADFDVGGQPRVQPGQSPAGGLGV